MRLYTILTLANPHTFFTVTCFGCTLMINIQAHFLQLLEMYLRENDPVLLSHMPSIEEPVQFDDTVNKATLVLPTIPGYKVVSDVNVLEVRTDC